MDTCEAEFVAALQNGTPAEPPLPPSLCVQTEVYGHVPDRDLLLDCHCRRDTPSRPRPAVLFLHGGGWRGGSRRGYWRQCSYLALKHGWFTASADYRLSGEAPFPAALEDAKCAVRWLRAAASRFAVDPERIAAVGGSAGGHLTAMLAATAHIGEFEGDGGHNEHSSSLAAAVCLNPALDLREGIASSQAMELVEPFLGAGDGLHHRCQRASPICWVNAQMPPMLLVHGELDQVVPVEQSVRFRDCLCELGVPVELVICPGKGHAWFNLHPDFWPVLQTVETFLLKHLGG